MLTKFLFFKALNDLSEEQGFPIEFLDGSIAEVSVSVPWSALLSDSSFVEIKGLCLVVHPKQQCKNGMLTKSDTFITNFI